MHGRKRRRGERGPDKRPRRRSPITREAVAQRRAAAKAPRPTRKPALGRLTPEERASLQTIKAAVVMRGFPLIAEVLLDDIERYAAQVRGVPLPGRKVFPRQFEIAATFCANRCGWGERTTQELEVLSLSPIQIGRPGFQRPSEGEAPATNGHAGNGHDVEHAAK